jgi:phosphohistidine phosphatase SixA
VRELILVRHASAGRREEWSGSDRLRPLDDRGRRQAEDLVAALAAYPVERILSSPYVRCTQTVMPLGAQRRLDVEERLELAEGANRESTLALIHEVEGSGLVVCTHGDVVEELLGDGMKKGEARVLLREPDGFRNLATIRPQP